MKKLLLLLLLPISCLGQAVYTNTYLAPRPLPTNGTTPTTFVRRTGPLAPTTYGGFPSHYDVFGIGGYRVVSNSTERLTIPWSRRKEMMLVGQASDTNLYMLDRSLTNWVNLGRVTTNGFPGINIYNSDGSITNSTRNVFGNGNDITFGPDNFEFGTFKIQSDNVLLKGLSSFTIKTPGIIDGSTAVIGWVPSLVNTNGLVEFAPVTGQNIANADLTSDGNHVLDINGYTLGFSNATQFYATTPLAAITAGYGIAEIESNNRKFTVGTNYNSIITSGVIGGTVTNGFVFTAQSAAGDGEWALAQNIANANLTWTGDTAQNGDGNDLDFLSFSQFNVSTSLAAGFHSNGTVDVGNPSGGKFVGGTGGINISVADTNQVIQLTTGAIIAGTATLGQVPTLIDTNGIVEFATVTGGTNIFNITYTYNITTNYVGENIANADLTADGNHTTDFAGFDQTWNDLGEFTINVTNGFNGSDSSGHGFNFDVSGIEVNIDDEGLNVYAPDGRIALFTPGAAAGTAKVGMFLAMYEAGEAAVEYSAVNYKGTASGTPGTWILATADVIPAYDSTNTPPEGTIVYARFPANSVAADTLRLGDNSADISITKRTGIAIDANDITADQVIMFVMTGTASSAHWVCESCGGGAAPSGQNIMNSDLSLDQDRTQDLNGHRLTFAGTNSQFFVQTPGGYISFNSANTYIDVADNRVMLGTPKVFAATVKAGQFLANLDGGDEADYSSAIATIETIADLSAQYSDVVMTQGYYTAGDGGQAVYRADPLSATATNTVTVFDRTAGGRYLLMTSGAISAKQAGAVGDGVTNDHDYLQAGLDASVNMAFRLEPLSYLSTGGLTVNAGVRVLGYGATVTANTSGNNDRAIDLLSNTKLEGLNVLCHRVSGGDSGEDHCAVRVGNFVGGVGATNVTIKNCTLSADWSSVNANAIFISGESLNVTVEGNTIPSSATLRGGIVCHWGYIVDGDATQGTVHSRNINIVNNYIGALTCLSGDGSGIYVSACYDVLSENNVIEQGRFAIIDTCGDYGYKYSGLVGKILGANRFHTCTVKRGFQSAIWVLGMDIDGVIWPLNSTFEDNTLIGSNDATGQGGIYLTAAQGTVFRNNVISGFEVGTVFAGTNQNLTFDSNSFITNRLGGLVMNDSSSGNIAIYNNKFQANGWGVVQTNAAGIRLLAGSNANVSGNWFGNPAGEPNQEVGIQCIPSFVNATILNNSVLSVKSGGVNIGYYFGGSSATGHLWLVSGNQAASGITLISGPANIPFLARGKYRTFTGTGTPSVGTYIKGDRVEYNEATASPFASICTVGGTSGTWQTLY